VLPALKEGKFDDVVVVMGNLSYATIIEVVRSICSIPYSQYIHNVLFPFAEKINHKYDPEICGGNS